MMSSAADLAAGRNRAGCRRYIGPGVGRALDDGTPRPVTGTRGGYGGHQVLPPVFSEVVDDQLVQVRLGVATSLFAALQCKNAAIAGHALRVALTCSAWAMKLGLPADQNATRSKSPPCCTTWA